MGAAPINLQMATADELNQNPDLLAQQDVVVLANVGSCSPELVDSLMAHVERGGGLLITLKPGEFESYNQLLSELLPHPLRDLHRGRSGAWRSARWLVDLEERIRFFWDGPGVRTWAAREQNPKLL